MASTKSLGAALRGDVPQSNLDRFGYLPGTLHLDPSLAPNVSAGSPRPFAPGEYMRNPNGQWSSEMSYTIADPALNNGLPTNIPGLWLKDGQPYHATEDEASQIAAQSGLTWPTYQKFKEAEDASAERENIWQHYNSNPEGGAAVRPLYVTPDVQSLGRALKNGR